MASTITSSGVRQTVGFTLPPTQNTAPVVEYRCLYTHDLKRKQKRWQDGVLRFHTFNKRIMVYDVSRNYIGDMHWREDEILQDGDEFELDRGVLIQAGEATGSIEQDLTGLFEKRKKAPEVVVNEEVPPLPVAVPMAKPAAAQPSQLQPKTLNALLGTPKGRIGRAALPTKSPHDLRVENENSQDRPAKRQRIESQLEKSLQTRKNPPLRVLTDSRIDHEGANGTVIGGAVERTSQGGRVPVPNNTRSLTLVQVNDKTTEKSTKSKDRIEKDEAIRQRIERLPKKRSSDPGSSEWNARQQKKRKPDKDAQISPIAAEVAKRRDHELGTDYAKTSTNTKSIEIACEEDDVSTNQMPKQISKLQMASRKPRKKLMYRDLLPQESYATRRSNSDTAVSDRHRGERTTSSRSESRRRDPMTDFHREEQVRLKARLNRHDAKEIQHNHEREESCGDAPQDLFLSQEDIETVSAENCNIGEQDPKDEDSGPPVSGSRRRNTEPVLSLTHRSLPQGAPQETIPRPHSSVHSTAKALAKMDEILLPNAQPRRANSVEDKDAPMEVLPQKSSPSSIPKTPPDVYSSHSPKNRPKSSPAFQTQARVPSSKEVNRDETGIPPRPNHDPPNAFAKAVQPTARVNERHIFPLESNLAHTPPPVDPILAPSSPKYHLSNRDMHIEPDIYPSNPPIEPIHHKKAIPQSDSLLAFSKIVAPKIIPAPESISRHKPTNQPAFTRVTPTNIPTPNSPEEIIEVPSSRQPSPSPPPEAESHTLIHPTKRKQTDSLPAFTKVVPTKPPQVSRSTLQKSVSDTSSGLRPVSFGGKESQMAVLNDDAGANERDESVGLWGKEAWDLFGCGRDGVECTYEEFKRKEGLV